MTTGFESLMLPSLPVRVRNWPMRTPSMTVGVGPAPNVEPPRRYEMIFCCWVAVDARVASSTRAELRIQERHEAAGRRVPGHDAPVQEPRVVRIERRGRPDGGGGQQRVELGGSRPAHGAFHAGDRVDRDFLQLAGPARLDRRLEDEVVGAPERLAGKGRADAGFLVVADAADDPAEAVRHVEGRLRVHERAAPFTVACHRSSMAVAGRVAGAWTGTLGLFGGRG